MKLSSIASGSSGNCIHVGAADTNVLVDVGISAKRIENGLKQNEIDPKEIKGIFITHEHIDHIAGLGVMMRRYKVPVFATGKTIDAMIRGGKLGKIDTNLFQSIEPDQPFQFHDLTVEASSTWHDAADPVCYSFIHGEKKTSIATDLGNFDDYIVEKLQGSNVLLLESNHDINMLEVGPYPYPLKRRILGRNGHLSNERAGQLLCKIMSDKLEKVFLGHLSKDNNYESLALETVLLELQIHNKKPDKEQLHIEVAKRDEAMPCYVC